MYKRQGIYNGGEDTGPSYVIPGEALDDPAFAALMEEATKYIGWPYVWGGSSPVSYTHLTLSDKIRKYVLPNLPYLFVFWFFSKIGTAYRLSLIHIWLRIKRRGAAARKTLCGGSFFAPASSQSGLS